MEVPCEEVARRAFISAPQRAVLDALPGVHLAVADATETQADNGAGLAPPQGGGTYMQEQDAPAFGDGPSAPASQPLKSSPRPLPTRNAEPPSRPANPRGASMREGGIGGVTPLRQPLARPGERTARDEPGDAHLYAELPSTQAPYTDAEAPLPPAKATVQPARFTAATLLAAIGSTRRTLHTERKA